MTRKMSWIYIAALNIAHEAKANTYHHTQEFAKTAKYQRLCEDISKRIVDRMMSRPHRLVSDIAKAHGMVTHADNSEINLTKRFEDDMEEGRR